MTIPLMNCATPFDIPFFLGGRPLTSLWSSWTRDGALSRDRAFISLYIQTPKSAPRQDIILIIIARTRLYKTNLMVIFVLDHPWHELLPSSLGSSLLHRAAKITMMTLLLLSLFSVLLHWLQYLFCVCSLFVTFSIFPLTCDRWERTQWDRSGQAGHELGLEWRLRTSLWSLWKLTSQPQVQGTH